MTNLKHIHLRLNDNDMLMIQQIMTIRNKETQLCFDKEYGYTDALKEGLSLLYQKTIEHKFKLVPTTEEEKTELIEKDKAMFKKGNYRKHSVGELKEKPRKKQENNTLTSKDLPL